MGRRRRPAYDAKEELSKWGNVTHIFPLGTGCLTAVYVSCTLCKKQDGPYFLDSLRAAGREGICYTCLNLRQSIGQSKVGS